ncbi:MAG: SDR family NAD(P)-dependent oxidoreductase [Ahrensia sp.]|nr:SDR family NAD(P)-dependent oxidoreductase [Ahrensia sp.]
MIIGRGGFKDANERIETIRRARASGLNVMTFRGVENADLDATGRLLREVDVLSMLNREQYEPDENVLAGVVAHKRILVTGGAGSIGSQLAQRCLMLGAAQVVIADRSEAGVFHWLKNLPEALKKNADARLVDVASESGMTRVFREFKPDIVFHAAALKHVPLVEANWASAITTNILGTWICAQLAQKFQAQRFVFISTDKAVEPTTFLGLTKRFGELICGAMNQHPQTGQADGGKNTRFTSVRFGNVFGTEGSVVNVFEEQIKAGGALTITHPEMRRYFMTANEASSLVILSTAIDTQDAATSSRIYVLEMGEQIKIIDIARAMIRLAGKNPDVDVEIKITGVRQFEKLEEKLVADDEPIAKTNNNNILITRCPQIDLASMKKYVETLVAIAISGDFIEALEIISAAQASGNARDATGKVIALNPKRGI